MGLRPLHQHPVKLAVPAPHRLIGPGVVPGRRAPHGVSHPPDPAVFGLTADPQPVPLPGHPHLSGGVAVVMVSHDVAAAVRYADHILHLGNHGAWFGTTAAYLETPEGRRFAAKGKEGETV